ncbi:MAG: hypothetical protein KC619_30525 [Myxococcales bacterium]|nr:hypothetical protein [Myxococcales bacterium]
MHDPTKAWVAALAAVLCGLSFLAATTEVGAQRRPSGAQVYITQTRPPRLPTERALIGWARSHRSRFLDETHEDELAQRKWLATMVVAFRRQVGDLEYQALFYDRGRGGHEERRFTRSMAFMLNSRDERTFVQPLRLPRPDFQPLHTYEMVITVRRQEMGTTMIALRGEEPRRTGRVDFTDEDR